MRVIPAAILAALALGACGITDPRPPNLVLIMVDDLGRADVGCYTGRAAKTPNIDRLAARGMRFVQAYSGCVVSAPARSTLMTGQHMGHTSVRLDTGGTPLLDADVTVAEILRDHGYATGGFGTWGLGDLGTPGAAESQGFQEFFGYYHQIHARRSSPSYLIDTGKKVDLPGNAGLDPPQGRRSRSFPRRDPATGRVGQFAGKLIKDRTLAFIRRHRHQPFFCYAPWPRPRPPGGDAMTDRYVGEVLALLDELHLTANTVVFFLSAPGAAARFPGLRETYQGGPRVPMIVRWPGHIAAGVVSDHPCYFPDVLPTLADLAGAPPAADIDGQTFLPTLLGQPARQRTHEYLYWELQRYDGRAGRDVAGGLLQAARFDDWQAVKNGAAQSIALYRLGGDLVESRDLAGQYPNIVRRAAELLARAHRRRRPQREPNKPNGQRYR